MTKARPLTADACAETQGSGDATWDGTRKALAKFRNLQRSVCKGLYRRFGVNHSFPLSKATFPRKIEQKAVFRQSRLIAPNWSE